MSALEGSVENVGEEVVALEGCDFFWRCVKVGCSPCASPCEVFW